MGRDVEKRANRGKRMSALIEETQEADDDFWNQEAFKEEEEDNEYQEEGDDADEFDSDFDLDEPEDDEEDAEEVDKRERRQPKKKVLPGRPAKKAKKDVGKAGKTGAKDGSLSIEKAAAAADKGFEGKEAGERPARRGRPKKVVAAEDEPEQATLEETALERRKSTRAVVILKDRQREKEQAYRAAVASKTVKKKKVEVEERRMTQEEMLQEAAQTEMQNIQRLEIMLAREEEVKRRAIIEKEVFSGPQIRYHSTADKTVLEFLKFASLPETIKAKAPPYPKRVVCVVTGLPAKYRDPQTGLPYATKEAFRVIRERAAKGEGVRGGGKGARGSGLPFPGSKGKSTKRGPSPALTSRSGLPRWRSSESPASRSATGHAGADQRGRTAGASPSCPAVPRSGSIESRGTIGVSRLSKKGGPSSEGPDPSAVSPVQGRVEGHDLDDVVGMGEGSSGVTFIDGTGERDNALPIVMDLDL